MNAKFFIGLVLGIAIAGGLSVYLNKTTSPFIDKVEMNVTNTPSPINSSSPITLAPSVTLKEAESQNNSSDQNYDFYDVLPGKKNLSEQSSSPVSQNAVKYYVQVGAFSNQNAANDLKAKLALLGISSTINSSNKNNNIVNRVIIGPLDSQDQANQIVSQLNEQHISNVLVIKSNQGAN